MSRPYSKNKGRGGGRGHFGNQPNDGAAHNGRGRWTGRGGYNNNNHNFTNNNKNNIKGGGSGGVVTSVMTTMLDLLFQKSSETLFNPQNGMLNLSSFHNSPDLSSVQRSVDFNSVAFCKSLADVIKSKIGSSLRIIALNDNRIQKLSVFLNALEEADVHNGLTAISATGNNIAEMQFLGPLRKFSSLGELLLTGNPVTKRPDYRAQIVKSLSRLGMLDGEVIDRAMLRLPNPIPPQLNETQLGALRFLESNLFAPIATRDYDALVNVYHPHAVFSVSRTDEPIPRRLPFDAAHRRADLPKAQRHLMQSDFALLRSHILWRNLQDAQTLRHVALGRAKASLANKAVGGGDRRTLRLAVELHGSASVVFLTHGVRVPTCVATLHGRLAFRWGDGDGPALTCLFDRTLALLLDPAGGWAVHNDMLHLRPDRQRAAPLFDPTADTRVEAMRRRLLPAATHEVMRAVMECLGSDADVQRFAAGHIPTLPPERVERAMADVDAMMDLLRG